MTYPVNSGNPSDSAIISVRDSLPVETELPGTPIITIDSVSFALIVYRLTSTGSDPAMALVDAVIIGAVV